jgi:hypothetical protein
MRCSSALQAALPTQAFPDPEEALADLRSSCHETCLLVSHRPRAAFL